MPVPRLASRLFLLTLMFVVGLFGVVQLGSADARLQPPGALVVVVQTSSTTSTATTSSRLVVVRTTTTTSSQSNANTTTLILNGGGNGSAAWSLPVPTNSAQNASATGIAVNITGSAPNAIATVSSRDLGQAAPEGTFPIVTTSVEYYDISLNGTNQGQALVCVTNSRLGYESSLSYFAGSTWVEAITGAASHRVCGSIPVSALHGTPIAVVSSTNVQVNCHPSTVGLPTTCKANVVGTSPTGVITWSSSSGKLSANSCRLSRGACSLRYTPTSAGPQIIRVSYSGDRQDHASFGVLSLSAARRASVTTVVCVSDKSTSGPTVKCIGTVTGFRPDGGITWSETGGSSITFSTSTCVLVHTGAAWTTARCSVTLSGTTTGRITVQARYNGDANNAGSSGTRRVTVD